MTVINTVLVPLKRVVDANVRVRVKPNGSGMALDGVKMCINPFDEIALEEALRIRERARPRRSSWRPSAPRHVLNNCGRVGMAPTGPFWWRLSGPGTPDHRQGIVGPDSPENSELVIMGKQAIDSDNNQTGQMLAALWGRPQATFTSRLSFSNGVATAMREVDAGLEVVEFDLPAVVTTDLRLNEPRYTKLPDILKAKKKPLETLTLADLNVAPEVQFRVMGIEPPAQRPRGEMVRDVPELVQALRQKELV